MLDNEVAITIPGHPAPKGSLKCIGGRGGRGHVLIEDNARTKDWRTAVALWCSRELVKKRGIRADAGQPVGVEVTFTLPRPKNHYGTGRNSGALKSSAPEVPVGHQTGDTDKLARTLLDALQDSEVMPDDCAVVELVARKAYMVPPGHRPAVPDALGYPGVLIRLYPL